MFSTTKQLMAVMDIYSYWHQLKSHWTSRVVLPDKQVLDFTADYTLVHTGDYSGSGDYIVASVDEA